VLLLGILLVLLFIVLGFTVSKALLFGILIGLFVIIWDGLGGRNRL
jgi:hypothetical protein